MSDFKFLQNPISKEWVILAPRRASRPDIAKGTEQPVCPFCLSQSEDEVYRVKNEENAGWKVRVLKNKFPFAPIHEVIIHSPDHHQNFSDLPLSQIELVLETYRQRYLTHQKSGQVYIFHNHGEAGGESLLHPHTQLVVIPHDVNPTIARLDPKSSVGISPKPLDLKSSEKGMQEELMTQTDHFYLFCPQTSQWPDEVWVTPKKRNRLFGEITDIEIKDLAILLNRLIQILEHRHNGEFPFNFYIYPGEDWYLRIMPRLKSLGGFEIGTGIFVNTQDPNETMAFIKQHFNPPAGGLDFEEIKTTYRATYKRTA